MTKIFFFLILDTVQLPARKFHDSDDSPTAMSLNEKEQIILNSGEELFAEIRYVIMEKFLWYSLFTFAFYICILHFALAEIKISTVLARFLVRKLK